MRREFILNLLLVIGANLLVKPLYIFGIDRTVQNVVGPESYGVYFALFNFTLLFQIVADLGLQNFNNKTISQSGDLIHQYFPSMVLIKTALALVFLGLIFLGGWILGYTEMQLHLLLWVGLNTILVSFVLYLRSNISGIGKYRWDSLLSILDKVLMILIIGYLLYSQQDFSIEMFIYGQTVALIITALIVWSISFRIARPLKWPTSWTEPIAILKKSFPYAMVILLMTLYTRIDAVMLERILPDGAYQAGVYASGYRIFDAINMFGFLTAGLLLPMFSKMIAENENTFPLYGLSLKGIWLVAVFIAVTCFVFRQELTSVLYTNSTTYWGEVLGCLMLSSIFVLIGYVTGPLLNANGSIHRLNWIFLISIFFNIGLNWLLIQQHKAYGAAIATLFTQGFVVLAQIFFVNKTMDFSFVRYPAKAMIFGALLLVLGIVGLKYIAQSHFQYTVGILVIGVILLIYLIIFVKRELGIELIHGSDE